MVVEDGVQRQGYAGACGLQSQGCENVALYLHESTYDIEMMELEL